MPAFHCTRGESLCDFGVSALSLVDYCLVAAELMSINMTTMTTVIWSHDYL
jgi:hypothetical protein